MKNAKLINWAELPSELIYSILHRLSVPDRLGNARHVCRSWRRVCQDPLMWRKIEMRDMGEYNEAKDYYHAAEAMCRRAVDLSQGGLLEINIEYVGTDSLLAYIADRSSNLKQLVLTECNGITDVGLLGAVMKLKLLEHLELSYFYFMELDLESIGLSCPLLKTLKLNNVGCYYLEDESDDDALAIAKTMPGLHHLQLVGNRVTNTGLNAIVENCPHLKSLDLRDCGYINLAPQ
ncbi:putative F-box/LRR-repeat protein 23 [Brassica napus]|uniref:putative F-box/LRR-repeat protein 23 n=1 Tax=Brassica napus TaxID=3708 RepID=UPI0020787C3B|nr:putative F-box/LRR-repeat protein 23 [Brassica napus]XP_048633522.1 putative F-box/LRR-repeat protein 23 [Brassica napus]XP_048633523.1 putative F-box/LRR-repeat protein 23 [Brassica napus]XP_048633524.1 putative F-box/LRR-repeat protein 23 [Brassica napus]